MEYRLARASDRPAMRLVQIAANKLARKALYYQLDDVFGPTKVTRLREDPGRGTVPDLAFVAVEGDRVIGFSGWNCQRELGLANIKGNYVHPDYWGRGISRKLVNHVTGKLRECGCPVLKVRTEESNSVVRHIYEKAGFRLFATAPNYALRIDGPPPSGDETGIRPAQPEDRDALTALLSRKATDWRAWEPYLLEETYGRISSVDWRSMAQSRIDALLGGAKSDQSAVVETGDGPVGFISWDGPKDDGHAAVTLLLINETQVAQGKRLVEAACRRMVGGETVSCEVLDADIPSIEALKGAGFQRVGAIVINTQR